MTKEQLVTLVSEQVLIGRGYGNLPRTHLEWDRSNHNSQITLVAEDVEVVLEILQNLGVIGDLSAIE